jgi:PAS domain S-box-containing protein
MKKQEKPKRRPAPSPADATELRRRAEARLKDKKKAQAGKVAAPPSADETQRLLQELQIHQIELEMQNEELRRIQGDLGASQARYFDLYDLAPVGYCTLNGQGMILEINLAAATLLGAARGALIRQPLPRFILPGDQDTYDRHLKLLFETGAPQVCELRLVKKDAAPVWVRIDATAAQEADGVPVCRATIIDITERKRAEETLRESEGKYRTLFENAGEAIFVAQDGKVVFLNPMTTLITSHSSEEFTSRPFTDFIHADDRNMIVDRHTRRLRGENVPRSYAFRVLHNNGGFLWVQLDTILISWQGRPATLNFMTDITERKLAEEALKRSEEKYRYLFERALEGILVARGETLEFVNPAMERILGYPLEKITSETFSNFIHPDDRAMVLERHLRRMRGESMETGYDFRVIASDGTVKWLSINSQVIDWEGAPANLSFIADITERKRAEEMLRESEGKYREIFESITDVFYRTDNEGTLLIVSPSVEQLLGYIPDEIIGRKLDESYINPQERDQFLSVLREKGVAKGFEAALRTKDGSVVNVSTNAQFYRDKRGNILGVHGISRDVTDRKRAEEKEKETQALLRIAGEKAKLGGWSVNLEENRVIWSDEVAAIHEMPTGYPTSVEKGISFYAPEWHERITKVFTDCAQKGIPYDEEMEIITAGGKRVWVRTIGEAVKDKAGKILKVQGAFQDITDRKRGEEALQESEEKYRTVADFTYGWEYWLAPDRKYIYVSPACERISGYRVEEFQQDQNLMEKIIHSDDKHMFAVHIHDVLHGKSGACELEFRIVTRGGKECWISHGCQSVCSPTGEYLGKRGSNRDITERKKAEENLEKTIESLRKAFGATIQVMVSAVEARDPYTAGHQIRSADLARAIATEMGLPQKKIEGLRMGGSIHDIGKLSIPAEILSKPSKLTNIEFSLIKEHARMGYEMLKDVESPWPLAEIVYQHHERMDGSGYPRNLKGDEILMEARIMAVADVVEAMASYRPYRPAIGIEEALEEIEKNKGTLYDAEVADMCLRLFREKGYKFD